MHCVCMACARVCINMHLYRHVYIDLTPPGPKLYNDPGRKLTSLNEALMTMRAMWHMTMHWTEICFPLTQSGSYYEVNALNL